MALDAPTDSGTPEVQPDIRRLEDVLRKSERVLGTLIECAPAAIAILDRDMRYVAASRRYLTDYRLGPQDIIGCSHYEVFPDLPESWKEVHRRCLAGATERCERDRFPHADGRVEWERWEIIPWHEDNGEVGGLLLFSEIITERVEAEQVIAEQAARLRDSAGRYRLLFDASAVPALLLKLPQVVIVDANEAAETLTGYSKAEMVGKNGAELGFHSPQSRNDMIERFTSDGRLAGREATFTTRSGEEKAIIVNTNPLEVGGEQYALTTVQDITGLRRAEQRLRESEERYRLVLERSMDAILLTSPDGSILAANPAACAMFQRTEEEILRLGRAGLVNMADPRVPAILAERARTGSVRAELTMFRADGSSFPVELSSATFKDSKGSVLTSMIVRDLTERQRTQEALLESEERLRQSQKMEAVGQLAGGIAHDFNNLLTAIFGYCDLVLDHECATDEAFREDLLEIRHAAERAHDLTRQILAFSRRQALRPEVVSLNTVFKATEPLLRRTLGEDIDLETRLSPDAGLVEIDVHQFEQVLLNLVINARDAMRSGGRLTVETGETDLDEEYCATHADARPGRCVMMAVSDTGTGMDAETLSHIFEPFFTTKPPGEGTGLGLSTVYGIVRQSGGSISVYSEPGSGTSFKVYLPVAQARPAAVPATVPRPVTPAGGKETIVVVEDEAALRSLVSRVLEDLGYTVRTYPDADRALAALEDDEAPVHLALTDVVLPGQLQGNQFAERMRTLRPGVPVLFMSGYTRNAIVHAGRLDEGIEYLEKPFTPGALAYRIRELLDRPGE